MSLGPKPGTDPAVPVAEGEDVSDAEWETDHGSAVVSMATALRGMWLEGSEYTTKGHVLADLCVRKMHEENQKDF